MRPPATVRITFPDRSPSPTWSDALPRATLVDKLRLTSFMSTIGVLSEALGGELESRDVIGSLALFSTRP